MRPIPVSLLIHSATLNDVSLDENFSQLDTEVAALHQVRFEPSTRVVVGTDNADVQCTAMLFFDAISSIPQGLEIKVEQSIIWEGRRYIVQAVRPLYDNRKLHHLEVDLSDG